MLELLLLLPALAGLAFLGFGSNGGDDDGDSSPSPTPNSVPAADNVIEGTGNADVLRGSAEREFMLGGANADKIEGGAANDVLLGEAGSDSIFGGIGSDVLLGGAGNDAVFGGRGFDTLIGGAGNDALNGGAGNDLIAGSSGTDKIEGGAGADIISGYDLDTGATATTINMVAAEPQASAKLEAIVDTAEANFGADATADVIARLRAGLTGADTVNGDDALFGGRGNDTIFGDFSDTMSGGQGADAFTITSDGANEVVTITDLNPAEDTLRIFVPAGANTAVTFINGATPEIGVTVQVAGDAVAQLIGLTSAQIPAGFIQVTNA